MNCERARKTPTAIQIYEDGGGRHATDSPRRETPPHQFFIQRPPFRVGVVWGPNEARELWR